MSSLRQLVSATTPDSISTANIRRVLKASIINLWASTVTVTDTIACFLDQTEIMAAGTANVRAAAVGLINVSDDQLLFNTVVGRGDLRLPTVVTTSQIQLLSVEPIDPFGPA